MSICMCVAGVVVSFFFKHTATPEIYTYCHTLSLHDALPICANLYRRNACTDVDGSPGACAPPGSPVWPAWHDHHRLHAADVRQLVRSEEHTSELQSLMRISYAVFCLKKKKKKKT